MKKLWTGIICLLAAGLLVGCTSSADMLKSYSDTALNTKGLIINTDTPGDYDFFAEKLVVFPKGTTVSGEEDKNSEDEGTSETDTMDSSKTETAEESQTQAEEEIDAETGLLAGIDNMKGIYGKNVYDRVYPASVTKIMTALIVMEKADFNASVVFTEDMVVDEYGAKLCGFEVGDVLTVEQLFNGLLIYSGNDAANALAVHIAGSVSAFAEMMNAKARELGCVDTHFVNPSGLHDSDHYTSAYDLYLIFNKCLEFTQFTDTIRQTTYDITYKDGSGNTIATTYETTNQYFLDIYDYPSNVRVIGGKTGTTNEAGSCLILYNQDAEKKGYISVVLGAVGSQELYSEMNILLNKITK